MNRPGRLHLRQPLQVILLKPLRIGRVLAEPPSGPEAGEAVHEFLRRSDESVVADLSRGEDGIDDRQVPDFLWDVLYGDRKSVV